MREFLEQIAGDNQFYSSENEAYRTNEKLPFRVAPEPFWVDEVQARTLERLGPVLSDFWDATAELYAVDERAHELLDRGKPEIMRDVEAPNYIFLRPDIVVTEEGLGICEIETSIFGLGLAELLNRGFSEYGFDTLAEDRRLQAHITASTPPEGMIAFSDKTKAFEGQLKFLADTVFSASWRFWGVEHAKRANRDSPTYRAHYLHEYLTDRFIKRLYEDEEGDQIVPGLTPQFEEKAILAFLWDKRFERHYRQQLGDSDYDFLKTLVLPTWIVGEEESFSPGLPGNFQESVDLATLPRSKRGFVLKASGFGDSSSWSEGVSFLQDKSSATAREQLTAAQKGSCHQLQVVQEFREGAKLPVTYEDGTYLVETRNRFRLTPYYSTKLGELLVIKATGCEGTNRIHASTTSVNTAVAVK